MQRNQASGGRFEQPLDLSTLLNMFQRRWRLFTLIVVTMTILSVAVTLKLTPVFTSTAQIKIDPTVRREIDANTPNATGMPDQAVVDTEVAIMHSRAIAEAVVDKLGLAGDPEFSTPKVGLLKRLAGGKPKPQTPADARETAIANAASHLETRRAGGTYVVNVSFRALEPVKAAMLANAFADAYIQNSLSTRVQDASRQSTWLNQQLATLGSQAESADAAVARYKAASGIATLGANGQTVTDQQIAQITTQLATAESEAAASRSNLQAAREQIANGGLESVSGVLSSNVIADLRRQRTEVMRNAAEINSRYGPLHPEAQKVQQQLDGLDQQIKAEGQRIVSGLQSASQSAEARASAIRAMLNELKGQQSGNERASVEADALQRQADSKHLIYNQLAQTAQLTGQERQSQETRGRIVDAATPAAVPSFPNKRLFAVLGLLMGVVAGAAVILLLEALETTVRTADDVESGLGTELIASVPRLTSRQFRGSKSKRPFDFVLSKPMSGFAEALRTVRSTLLLSGRPSAHGGGRVVAVTSALPNEGKTTCAASLARIMGMSGERVLLIDCDLRRRALQGMGRGEPTAGLLDVLTGAATLEQALQPDIVKGVDLLTSRDTGFSPMDMLGGEEMRKLLNRLRNHYDHIVLDAPPVLAVADARTTSALADNVLLVVRWRKTTRVAARAALAQLENDGAPVSGVVLTMVDTWSRGAVGAHNPAYYYSKAQKAYYQD
ncbi:MAG: polysaccharide biosynthesis tyrosine autokinase [Caulobacteraceae bacterium]